MGERSTLLALSLIAAVLAAAVAIDRTSPGGDGGRPGTRLFPALSPSQVTGLTWQRPDAPVVELRRTDAGFSLVSPIDAPADAAAVADVLGTLELLSYRRRVSGAYPEAPRATLTIDRRDARPVTLAFGAAAPELGQTWVGVDGDPSGYLIDGYAARALDRTADELRERDVFAADSTAVSGVELSTAARALVLSGRPLAVHLPGGGRARLDPARAAELLAALDAMRVAAFTEQPGGEHGLRVRVLGGPEPQELRAYDACDERTTRARTPVGAGCVDLGPLPALVAAEPMALVDRRLVSLDPARVIAIEAGGARIDRDDPAWDEAAAWLDELAAVEASSLARADAGVDGTAIALHTDREVERFTVNPARGLARRAGEPVTLALPPAAAALVATSPTELRPRQVLTLEPALLRGVTVRRGDRLVRALERGALVDDWPRDDLDAVRAFRQAFARLRAQRWLGERTLSAPLSIEATFDPPPGASAPVEHVLELDEQCRARLRGERAAFAVDEQTCAALRGLVR